MQLEHNRVQHADILGESGDMVRAQADATLLQRERDAESPMATDHQPPELLRRASSASAADAQQFRRRGSQLSRIPEYPGKPAELGSSDKG